MASTEKGSRKGWILAAVLLVTVAVLASVIGYLMLERPAVASEGSSPAATQRAPQALFLKLEPFTVNLQSGTCGDRLLYVGITLEVGNATSRDFIKSHLPQIRSRMLMLLSGQDAATLITGDGKKKLAAAVLDLFKTPFTRPQPALLVDDVLFTQFIVQ